jgi:hypothetical protein
MRHLIVVLVLCPTPILCAAELTARETRRVQVIDATIMNAGRRYAAGQFEQAAASIAEAIRQIEVATSEGSSDLYETLEPAMRRIEKAHAMLEFEGISLPPFERPKRPADSEPKVARPKSPRPLTNKSLPKASEAMISFAGDVAPLLVDNCKGCHINAMQTRGGLRMDTFAQLLSGGDSGRVIIPGKGAESLLVQRLRGIVGERMPSGRRPALSDGAIKLISTWIDEGATLDGASENQPLPVMSQLAWAASATSQQISQRRARLAEQNIELVTGGSDIQSKTTDHFLVIGATSNRAIDLVAQLAEAQMKTVKTVVSGDEAENLFHGRATVLVWPRRYDYSEFAKMVEGRSLPSSWESHWKFDGIDAYISVVATERDHPNEIADRLLAPTVSLAVATRGGDVPRWFAEGIGVATASRRENSRDREARRRAETEIWQALAAMASAKSFLKGELSPQQTDRIGAAIAASLLDRTHRRNFDALLRNLAGGKPFEQAFTEAFGAAPAEFVQSWMRWARGG